MPRGRSCPVHTSVGVLREDAVRAVGGVLIALEVVRVDHGVGASEDLLDLEVHINGSGQGVESGVLDGHVDPSGALAYLGLTGSGVVRRWSNRHPSDADILIV